MTTSERETCLNAMSEGLILLKDIDTLSEDQKEMIISLPYRAGVWVSESDASGGEEADARERQVLESIVISYAQDFCKSEFVQRVMEKTVDARDRWGQWGQDIHLVPQQCREAVYLLSAHLPEKDLNSFRHILVEIGVAIATAYREFGEEGSFMDRARTYATAWLNQVKIYVYGGTPKSMDELLRISRAEDQAIKALCNALGVDYNRL